MLASPQRCFDSKCRIPFDLIDTSLAVSSDLNQVVIIAWAEEDAIHGHESLSVFIALVVYQYQLDDHFNLHGTALCNVKVVLEATGKIRLRTGIRSAYLDKETSSTRRSNSGSIRSRGVDS